MVPKKRIRYEHRRGEVFQITGTHAGFLTGHNPHPRKTKMLEEYRDLIRTVWITVRVAQRGVKHVA